MVPLIEHYENNRSIAGYRIKTDIGPMKQLLTELPLNIVEIVGPDNTLNRSDAQSRPDHITLPAYDIFVAYIYGHGSAFRKSTITKVLSFFSETVPPYVKLIPTYDVILIERTNTERYYQSVEKVEKEKLSGALLRSIANHRELTEALSKEYGCRFCNITLERSSIYYQYHLFSNARVVIAQHGAALSNAFFMKPEKGATVIEIFPPAAQVLQQFKAGARTHFINLAKHMGLRHVMVNQSSNHSDVCIADVLTSVRNNYSLKHEEK